VQLWLTTKRLNVNPIFVNMTELSTIPPQFQHLTLRDLRINDHTLDEKLSAFPNPADTHHFRPPTTYAGALDALPLELVHDILSQLELSTLLDFQRASRRARALVHSLPEYKAIITHAHNALYGILGIKTGCWITCRTLYEKLCRKECEQCGDFGGYLYLLTCKRVCFLCLANDRLYLPIPRTEAGWRFGLDRHIVDTLPLMRVIPGKYAPNNKKATRSVLVDYESAFLAGVELHGSLSAMNKYVSDMATQKLEAYNANATTKKRFGVNTSRMRLPRMTDPHDGHASNPLRFVAIVAVPALSTPSQEVEQGFYCLGCDHSSRPPLRHWRRKFTAASFEEHLRQCGEIKNGEHHLA